MSKEQKQTKKEPEDTKAVVPQVAPEEQQLAEMAAYEQYAGAGFEHQTADDLVIPFLTILQGLSKAVVEDPRNKVPGMIFNTVTGEAVEGEEGVSFVPATTQHLFVEWKPRKTGGGFVGVHEAGSPVVKEAVAKSKQFGQYSTMYNEKGEPCGNDLMETFYVYGLSLGKDRDECVETAIAFSSTSIKAYKAWQTKAKSIQIALPDGRRIAAPLFSHIYRLRSVGLKNAKGTWHSWSIGFDGTDAKSARLMPSDMRFQAAARMGKVVSEGKARVAHEAQGRGDEEPGSSGAVGDEKPVF